MSETGDDPRAIFRDGLLKGQVALITGGGTGIGRGVAELCSQLGAHVVLASRKAETLEATAAAIRERGGSASIAPMDVRDAERVRETVERVAGERGRIDLLVNNAAGNFYAPSALLSANAWRAVVEIDLYGTFYCSQAVAPVMRSLGGGRIVNISMTLHYRGWPQMAHATAAKAGIDALTRTLAVEWAPWGIRVNAVAPGPIPTEGVRRAFSAPRGAASSSDTDARTTSPDPASGSTDRVTREAPPADVFQLERAIAEFPKRAIPLGRWGTPRDIANAVAFLASPGGDWITGAILVVDGGEWLARPGAP